MSSNPVLAEAVGRIGSERVRLAVTGLVVLAFGVTALLSPRFAGELVLRLLGLLLWGAVLVMGLGWLLGRGRHRHRRGVFVFLAQILLMVVTANALLFHTAIPMKIMRFVFGALFVLDAGTQGVIALQAKKGLGRWLLLASAVVTAAAGVLAVVFVTRQGGGGLLALLLGVRLVVFGVVLCWLAWTTTKETAFVYGLRPDREVEPVPGEAYAVFIGNAFHLGVYVGDGEVVDYRDDNLVHLVTWEQFLLGREPEHWQYPDLPDVPAAEVCRIAREAVGRTYPYKFFEFNCESFAVWCKSGGTTHQSKYAQVALAFSNISVHPVVGVLAEFYTRAIEFAAFHLGGTFGKQTALVIRRTSAAVSKTLLARRLDADAATRLPERVQDAGAGEVAD